MTQVIDINNIQNKLAKLIAQLKLGEEILIAKKDKPIAKLIGITETDNELKVELVIFYTDYASVFSEADREDKYKESDFKLIVLSMLSELYSCSMGINNFISKTLLSALENIKKGTKDEEKR